MLKEERGEWELGCLGVNGVVFRFLYNGTVAYNAWQRTSRSLVFSERSFRRTLQRLDVFNEKEERSPTLPNVYIVALNQWL